MDEFPIRGCLSSKVALITGAGRGIGRATAELFAREGAKVVRCSRTKDQLAETVSAIASAGGQTSARGADIGIAREAEALVRLAFNATVVWTFSSTMPESLGPRFPL